MKYNRVSIYDLKTCEDCDNAIESIERDYENCHGGFRMWNSGLEIDLLEGAKKKIAAINRRNDKLFLKMIKDSYKEYAKNNPDVTWETYYEDELYC